MKKNGRCPRVHLEFGYSRDCWRILGVGLFAAICWQAPTVTNVLATAVPLEQEIAPSQSNLSKVSSRSELADSFFRWVCHLPRMNSKSEYGFPASGNVLGFWTGVDALMTGQVQKALQMSPSEIEELSEAYDEEWPARRLVLLDCLKAGLNGPIGLDEIEILENRFRVADENVLKVVPAARVEAANKIRNCGLLRLHGVQGVLAGNGFDEYSQHENDEAPDRRIWEAAAKEGQELWSNCLGEAGELLEQQFPGHEFEKISRFGLSGYSDITIQFLEPSNRKHLDKLLDAANDASGEKLRNLMTLQIELVMRADGDFHLGTQNHDEIYTIECFNCFFRFSDPSSFALNLRKRDSVYPETDDPNVMERWLSSNRFELSSDQILEIAEKYRELYTEYDQIEAANGGSIEYIDADARMYDRILSDVLLPHQREYMCEHLRSGLFRFSGPILTLGVLNKKERDKAIELLQGPIAEYRKRLELLETLTLSRAIETLPDNLRRKVSMMVGTRPHFWTPSLHLIWLNSVGHSPESIKKFYSDLHRQHLQELMRQDNQ